MHRLRHPAARPLAPLLLGLILSACAVLPAPSAPAAELATGSTTLLSERRVSAAPSVARVRAALLTSSRGLLYPSESDEPWTWLELPPAASDTVDAALPDAATVAARLGFTGEGVETETHDADEWFARLARTADPNDPARMRVARRHELLRRTFGRWYDEVRVYRIRDARAAPAEWHIVVLGRNRWGVSGLRTLAIET